MRKGSIMMKLFRMFGRGIRDAFKSVFRNSSLSLASVSCITITLIVIAISLLVVENVNNFTDSIKEDVTLVVFINRSADDLKLEEIVEEIDKISNVQSSRIKTKEETRDEFVEDSGDVLGKYMEDMDEDELPLKDSILVKVIDLKDVKDTVAKIKEIELVDSVNYGESMVEKMVDVFDVIKRITILILIALIAVNIFLIVNTIKLTIFSRKREISIMRLVGASNFSIKFPFVIEGMVIGMIGSIIPIMLVVYGYTSLYLRFDGVVLSSLIKLENPQPLVLKVSLIVLVIGIVVGMIGSSRAVRKFLKV